MSENYNYDAKSDSLFICLKDGPEDSFEEILPGLNLEFNKKHEIIGIEVLNASRFGRGINKTIKKIQSHKSQAIAA